MNNVMPGITPKSKSRSKATPRITPIPPDTSSIKTKLDLNLITSSNLLRPRPPIRKAFGLVQMTQEEQFRMTKLMGAT